MTYTAVFLFPQQKKMLADVYSLNSDLFWTVLAEKDDQYH